MARGVVARPELGHACNPGVEWREIEQDQDWPGLPKGTVYAKVPTQHSHPAGTVWACDCGKTYVSKPPRYVNWPGDVTWRREHWWERRRRRRADGQTRPT